MILLVHGGAGNRRPGRSAMQTLEESLICGYRILGDGGTALEAVVESIRILEDSGKFNAGAGGNLQLDGARRLDASLMEGKSLRAGSVIGVEGVRNPVLIARAVMQIPHVMLTDVGARMIARAEKIPSLPSPDQKALDRLRKSTRKEKEMLTLYERYFSTVGAVALDDAGSLAAGASTGGTPAMLPGRVGDTPIIGAGVYADNSLGAVSCTGMGEYIIRLSLAKEICMNMKRRSSFLSATLPLNRLLEMGGQAGIISVKKDGRFVLLHTTEYMAAGYAENGEISVGEGFRRIIRTPGQRNNNGRPNRPQSKRE